MKDKRIYVLTIVIGEVGVNNVPRAELWKSRDDAIARMKCIRDANDPSRKGDPINTSNVSGDCKIRNHDVRDEIAYKSTGMHFNLRLQELGIDPEGLDDFETDYEVEVVLTKKYVLTMTVTEKDEQEAHNMAYQKAIEGDYDDHIDWDYPDDEDVEIGDVSEV